jgi:predicted phage terminase large subunit-like protein
VAWCDCAFGGGDFLSMPIAYVYDGVQYIVDWVYNDGAYNITEPKVVNKLIEHKVEEVVFAANNGGEFYAKDIKELLKKRKGKTRVFHRKASTSVSKDERIEQYTPDILGMCFKADEDIVPHSEYNHALNDLCRYSSKTIAKNKRDDAPDSLAGLASMSKTMRKVRISTYNRGDMPYL